MPDNTDTIDTDDLHTALADARRELDSLRTALETAERRRQIERALAEADAIDLETAALLTEAAVSQMDEADINAAVGELKRRKPFLFARRTPRSTVMAPRAQHDARAEHLAGAREAAASTGDRAALLRYLRLRRSA